LTIEAVLLNQVDAADARVLAVDAMLATEQPHPARIEK